MDDRAIISDLTMECNHERYGSFRKHECPSCAKVITQSLSSLHSYYKQKLLERMPKESLPMAGGLEDKYGYLAGQRKGFNSALSQFKQIVEEIFK